MMIVSKENPESIIQTFPRILALTASGEAVDWITYEEAAAHYAKGKVLYSLGTHEINVRGGFNSKTGQQSILRIDTIIALANDTSPSKYRKKDPQLTNKALFERDLNMCAYCGSLTRGKDLTRDHVHPTSKGGRDVWENVVTACYSCNQYKGAQTLEQAEMKLLYVPYTPTFNESLILKNRNILADQMEFLKHGVSKHSRVVKEYEEQLTLQ